MIKFVTFTYIKSESFEVKTNIINLDIQMDHYEINFVIKFWINTMYVNFTYDD